MWRRSKQVRDSPESTSPKGGSSHSLAKSLLRPFTCKPRQEADTLRSKSETHLIDRRTERNLRLCKSALSETTEGETRLGEILGTRGEESMERAPQVILREVRKLRAAPEIEEVRAATESSALREPAMADVSMTSSVSMSLWAESEGMPADVVKELTTAFRYFDHNSDGCIDKEELGAVMRSLGDHPSESELEAMIAAVDQNGDGLICLGEFLALNKMALESGLTGESDREMREAFDVFDLDKNGFISCEELQEVLSNLFGETVVKAECSRMIEGVDQDGDGQVNFQEFHTMMRQVMPC